jgi:D-serine deaminase-like pyridoxal phosphate-dependent protein
MERKKLRFFWRHRQATSPDQTFREKARILVSLDSTEMAQGLGELGVALGRPVEVYDEVDTGHHRMGRAPGTPTAEQLQVSPTNVLTWRARFLDEGVAKIGRGHKPEIPKETIDEIVRLTQETTPECGTHWSCRSMAKVVGVGPATVQRVWSARELKPP